jgi:hypothetical protein
MGGGTPGFGSFICASAAPADLADVVMLPRALSHCTDGVGFDYFVAIIA